MSNQAAEDAFKRIHNPVNKLVKINHYDHFNITIEEDALEQVVDHLASYFDSLLGVDEEQQQPLIME